MLRALKLATEDDCKCSVHCDDALLQAPNTTNCCEGFHHALPAIISQCKHPTSGNCLIVYLNDIGIHRLTVQNVKTSDVDFSKTKYAALAERLAQNVALYIDVNEPEKLHYLRATAHMDVPR